MFLFTKEWPWAICSLQKRDKGLRSWFEQIAHQKRAIRSKYSYFSYVFDSFPPFLYPKTKLSLFAHLVFFKEQLERFAPVALYKRATLAIHSITQDKRATLNNLLRSLMTKERWEHLLFFTSESWITLLLTQNERIAQKTDEQIPNPAT